MLIILILLTHSVWIRHQMNSYWNLWVSSSHWNLGVDVLSSCFFASGFLSGSFSKRSLLGRVVPDRLWLRQWLGLIHAMRWSCFIQCLIARLWSCLILNWLSAVSTIGNIYMNVDGDWLLFLSVIEFSDFTSSSPFCAKLWHIRSVCWIWCGTVGNWFELRFNFLLFLFRVDSLLRILLFSLFVFFLLFFVASIF